MARRTFRPILAHLAYVTLLENATKPLTIKLVNHNKNYDARRWLQSCPGVILPLLSNAHVERARRMPPMWPDPESPICLPWTKPTTGVNNAFDEPIWQQWECPGVSIPARSHRLSLIDAVALHGTCSSTYANAHVKVSAACSAAWEVTRVV